MVNAYRTGDIDLGASRWQIFRDITLPLPGPGVFAGFLFALLLSWGKFPLACFTSGADVTVPEWLYGKMIGAVILIVGLTINGMLQRRD